MMKNKYSINWNEELFYILNLYFSSVGEFEKNIRSLGRTAEVGKRFATGNAIKMAIFCAVYSCTNG